MELCHRHSGVWYPNDAADMTYDMSYYYEVYHPGGMHQLHLATVFMKISRIDADGIGQYTS